MKGVLVAAGGAGWESAALRFLDAAPGLRLARRCIDVADLVATAQAGDCAAALLSLELPGLDADAVYQLGQARVHPVAIDGDPARAAALGIVSCLRTDVSGAAGLDGLVDALPHSQPEPVAEPSAAVGAGEIVAVWGPAGAPGRSTVALGLADAWARRGIATLLVDADPYGGAIAQMLGILDEVSGLLAASRAANAGRAEELSAHCYRVGDYLGVLTGIPRPDLWPQLRAGAVDQILRRVRIDARRTVVDVGFCLEAAAGGDAGFGRRNQLTLQCLAAADRIVAVGRADPVGLTRLVRGLHELETVAAGTGIEVAINMTRSSLGWSEAEIGDTVERLTGRRPQCFLPQDRPSVDRAVMAGRLLSEMRGESRLAKSFRHYADRWPDPVATDHAMSAG